MRVDEARCAAAVVLAFASQHFRAVAATLGVSPEDESKYSAATFRCIDGSGGSLPVSVINDEFCHCADGSDEPGTGACAGQDTTLFYCANEGSVAKRIYASRVGDGVCDCCDGSDEASLASRSPAATCSNVCAEHGKREKEELERRADVIKRGVEKQHEVRAQSTVERANWRWEITRLAKDLPALEARLAEVKRRAAAIRAEEAKESAIANANVSSPVGQADKATEAEAPAEPKASLAALLSGAAKKLGAEPGDEASKADVQDLDLEAGDEAFDRKESEANAGAEEAQSEEVVSEYAKWMDGAESTLTKADAPVEEEETGLEEGEEEYENEESEGYSLGGGVTTVRGASGVVKKGAPATEAAPATGSTEEKEAEQAVSKNKERTKELENKLTTLNEEHLGYASLFDTKLQRRISEFSYKLDFFKSASQDHTSLGSWKGFTGAKTAEFTGGTACWQGPARSLKVTFECGVEAAIQDVVEPSRCVYAATVLHPGACDPTEVETLQVGSRVVGPKDEL